MTQSISSGSTSPIQRDQEKPSAPSGRRAQRAQVNTRQAKSTTQRSGSLEVTTAEGDKVSISFSALQQLQADQSQVSGKRGRAETTSSSQSAEVQVAVKIDGSLSDQEVAEITKLLQSLTSAPRNAAPPQKAPAAETLSNFQFHYQERTEVQYSRLSYVG